MNISTKFLLLLGISLFGLSACGDKKDEAAAQAASAEQSPSSTADDNKHSETGTHFLSDAPRLQAAEDALKALPQFQGKSLNAFQNVKFYGGESGARINIVIQDPNQPENFDEYTYEDGQWGKPQPVQITGDGDTKDNITPLDDIKFTTVATVAKAWTEKAKEVGAVETEPRHIIFVLGVSDQSRHWMSSNIETERAKYFINFNLDGTLKKFKKQ